MSVASIRLISKAFEVGTVHFGPRLLAFAAFQKMICGVSYDKIRLGYERCWVSPWRAPHCVCHAASCPAAKPTRDAFAAGQSSTPTKQGGRRVLWASRTCARPSHENVVSSRPPRCWGKTTRAPSRRLGPLPLLQGSDATDLPTIWTVATSYWRRPRAGRCASHAWSRPSSGTPSPCAIGAMLARSARMACALPRDSSRRR